MQISLSSTGFPPNPGSHNLSLKLFFFFNEEMEVGKEEYAGGKLGGNKIPPRSARSEDALQPHQTSLLLSMVPKKANPPET